MKKYSKFLIKAFLLLTVIMVSSCEADDNAFTEVTIGDSDVQSAYPLEPVTLTGDNFDQVQFVFVGNRQASFQLEEGELTFQVPEGAPIGETTVTLAMANNYRVTMPFQVLLRPNPAIEALSETAAPSGEEVTIRGVNLDNLESLTVGGVEASVVSNSGTELVFVVPEGLPNNTPAPIEIVTAGGEASFEWLFYVGENLILNGTFEEGEGDEFANWAKYNGSDLLTATTDSEEAYFGRSLMAVGAGANPWNTQLAADAAPTQVGTEYTLTMWIKGDAGTPGDGGTIRFSTSPDALYSGDYVISSEWQQIQWVFTANSDATQILLDLGVTADAVYFIDNVTLVATGQAGPQPTELAPNGGFELGEGDEFLNWSKYNGADLLTATTADGEVRSGDRALRAVGAGGDAWRTQIATDGLPTEVGEEYHVTFWVKGEAGSPGVGGVVRASTQSPTGAAMYGPDMTVSEEWQEYDWTFVANDVSTNVVLDLGATEGAVYFIDDFSVAGPPEGGAPPVEEDPLLVNGDFELGEGDEFLAWEKLNGAELLTATLIEGEVQNGNRALRAVGAGEDPWLTQIASDPIETEVGASYTVTMWVKALAGSPGVDGIIRISTQSPAGEALYSPDFVAAAEWTQYEWTFTATDVATRIVLDLGATGEAVYFVDNLEVVAE